MHVKFLDKIFPEMNGMYSLNMKKNHHLFIFIFTLSHEIITLIYEENV